MNNMDMLDELKGAAIEPAIEIFKVGPEITEDFISKLLVVMGAEPTDIQHIVIGNDRKKLRITAVLDKDSELFNQKADDRVSQLSLLGASSTEIALSNRAKTVLREFGYFYIKQKDDDDNGREVYMVSIEENKKNIEVEFNEEVTMAIITDTNFTDEFFIVDAVEEVVERRRKQERKKFKGKKKKVVFTKVERRYHPNDGFSPGQVETFHAGTYVSDDDDEDDE